jgi:C1A family cysteine protease
MPPVGYQGSEGTCAPFAAVYAARSSEQYHRTNATSYSYGSNIFSPEYVYNQTKAGSGCASGSSMVETLNFMVNKGVCTWQSMPYSDLNGCSQTPTAAQQAEAANYKIPYFSRLYTTDKVGIKTMLSQKHSLVVSFTFDQNFSSAGPGYIWKSLAAPYYGPHAVVLCGYDDSKNAYLAMNSWGNSWGDNGYIWIDYNFLSTISYDLYTMNY